MSVKTDVVRARPAADEKVVISFVNDKYRTAPKPTSVTVRSASPVVRQRDPPPPVIKRLHDASIQTSQASSSSRSPIRIHGHQRQMKRTIDEDEDDEDEQAQEEFYEPPVKRTSSSVRKSTHSHEATSTSAVKRSTTGVPISSRVTSAPVSSFPMELVLFPPAVQTGLGQSVQFNAGDVTGDESSTISDGRRCDRTSLTALSSRFTSLSLSRSCSVRSVRSVKSPR